MRYMGRDERRHVGEDTAFQCMSCCASVCVCVCLYVCVRMYAGMSIAYAMVSISVLRALRIPNAVACGDTDLFAASPARSFLRTA